MSILRLGINEFGRDFIVGDVHGQFTKLKEELAVIGFHPQVDRLIHVGDLVDRGPESMEALDWLNQPGVYSVSGNHESMAVMLADGGIDLDNYAANGGSWNIGNPIELRREIAETFRALPLAIEIETLRGIVGVIHAECPYASWDEFKGEYATATGFALDHLIAMAHWARHRIYYKIRQPITGLRALVVGHSVVPELTVLGNVHYIDTGGWISDSRKFTFLDAATLQRVE